MARVIITGCQVHSPARGEWAICDLWEEGDCYIFNCVPGDNGETEWMQEAASWQARVVTVVETGKGDNIYAFERRGVIVARKDHCVLNAAAEEYLR